MFRNILLALGVSLALPTWAQAPQPVILRIAAASDLRGALEKVEAAFRKSHPGISAQPSFGASGALMAQIRQGAPFDLFLAADLGFPEQLAKEGLVTDAVFPYSEGRLVLWIRADLALDAPQKGLKVLLDPRVKRVALANPEVAPYGRAAMEALRRAGLKLDEKLLRGENVAQAAQYLQASAAEAGLISFTQARHPSLKDTGLVWTLPAGSYPALMQGGAILKRSTEPAAARSFRDFLLGSEGRALLAQEGYGLP